MAGLLVILWRLKQSLQATIEARIGAVEYVHELLTDERGSSVAKEQ